MNYLGEPVYRAKINDKDRLVYKFYQDQEGKKQLYIFCISEHDYKKLKNY